MLSKIAARGVLDYVTNWYVKAAEFIQGTDCAVAFVSTNSICQGEQAGILWTELFSRYQITITFAYQTFPWVSEARGRAHVHVVIVGFALEARGPKQIFQDSAEGTLIRTAATNISPYLVPASDRVFLPVTDPISAVPRMLWGNKLSDGGHLVLSPEERSSLLEDEPGAEPFIRRYMGAEDFIDGKLRYCLWLLDATPAQIRRLPKVEKRLKDVSAFRSKSKAATTRAYANRPNLFRQIAQPAGDYLLIPLHTSEARRYLPIGFMTSDVIVSNACAFVPSATLFHFGVLISSLHMAWVRQIAGRIKSDIRYSSSLVYNNFPWPEGITDVQRDRVEQAAQVVLDSRTRYADSTLGELYDSMLMPADLLRAHESLDRAVERCYRREPFASDQARVEFLFAQYERATAPLLPSTRSSRRRL